MESIDDKIKAAEYNAFKAQVQYDLATGRMGGSQKRPPAGPSSQGVIQDVTFDVPTSAIYDRLSDGTYIPKYENYQGAFGNEDRLARQQSGFEQVAKGLGKNFLKVGTYALDATLGSAAGLVNAFSDGSVKSFWDNPVSNYLDDINKKLDNNLANYYTDEQKSMSWLRSMGTVNFWANDFAGALAFVGGAVLPEIAIGAMSGGATLGVGAAKVGTRLGMAGSKYGAARVAGKALNKADEFTKLTAGRESIRGYYRAVLGDFGGNVLSTGAFLARTSGFEAGMEARHNFKEAMDTYMTKFQEYNGRMPNAEELKDFTDKATREGNYVFAANLAILSVSNAVMFSKMLNPIIPKAHSSIQGLGKSLTNFGNRAIGLGYKKEIVKEGGKSVLKHSMRGANKFQKFLGNTYLVLGKPLTEGLYEEGMQGVAGGAMQNYLESLYNPNATAGYDYTAALFDAFKHQYGTDEGWKEMVIGMMVGFAGGAVSQPKSLMTGEALPGLMKNSRKSRYNQIQEQIETANAGLTSLQNLNRTSAMQAMINLHKSKEGKFDRNTDPQVTAFEDVFTGYQFIRTQEHIKSLSQIQEDFNTIIDNTQFDEEQVEALGEVGVDEYKQMLKDEFKATSKAYDKAKRYADALGFDRGQLVEMPNGEKRQLHDAVVFNLTTGQRALSRAENVAQVLEKIVGEQGVFSSLQFYNDLSQEAKDKAIELKSKKKKLEQVKESAKSLGQTLAGVKEQTGRQFRTPTLEKRYNERAQKLAVLTQEAAKLESEIANIEGILKNEKAVSDIKLGELADQDFMMQGDVITALDKISKLDTYMESLLQYGKKAEAEQILYLVNQFKMFSDSHRNMINMQRDMMQTGFFGSKQGRRFANNVRGKKYEMSEDFKQLLRDNNALIQNSIRLAGMSTREDDVLAAYEEAVATNPELSEREKYKIESVLRLAIGMDAAQRAVEQLSAQQVVEAVQENKNVLEGDTIAIAQSIRLRDMDFTNLDAINEAINIITKEIDAAVGSTLNDETRVANLQSQLNELRKAKEKNDKKDDQGIPSEEREGEEPIETQLDQEAGREEAQTDRDVQEQIEELERQIELSKKPFKIINSEEYVRYNELIRKKEQEVLSEAEELELEQLEEDIDKWLLVTGVVADGVRLSDLIRQKAILEDTVVEQVEDIVEIDSDEVVDSGVISEASDKGSYNSRYGQFYDRVMVSRKVDASKNVTYTIYHLTPEGFSQITGISTEDFSRDEKGNILLTEEQVEFINNNTNLSIVMDKKYSVVYEEIPSLKEGENVSLSPLKSDFNSLSEVQPTNAHNVQATYNLEVGDEVEVFVDPDDTYNQELIQEFLDEVGSPELFMDEDTFDDYVVTQVQVAISKDKGIIGYQRDLAQIDKDLASASTDKVAKLRKDKLKINEKISKLEDVISDRVEKRLQTAREKGVDAAKLAKAKDNLKKKLKIHFRNADGATVSTAKAYRSGSKKSAEDANFDGLRSSIVDTEANLVKILKGEAIPVMITNKQGEVVRPKVKVASTLLGQVNFTHTRGEDGVVRNVKSRIENAASIVDIGFVSNGKVQTRSGSEVRETFLETRKKTANTKTPFVVVKVGVHNVAIPVDLVPRAIDEAEIQRFQDIWDSNAPITDKVLRMNQFLASKGVDIKTGGFSTLNQDTLTDEFFANKLAEVKNKNYFYDLNEWLDKAGPSIEQIAQDQIIVNFDLANPIHSPKVVFDYSAIDTAAPTFLDDTSSSSTERSTNKNVKTASKTIADMINKKDCNA